MSLAPLPIDALLPELVAKLVGANCLVLRAPPGAGKTTRVAPALLDAGLAGQKSLLLLQPRRLAARTAAERIARERGVALGQEVGYQVRFERRASARTRILVMTDGMLLRRLQDDPFLEDVTAVVDSRLARRQQFDAALGINHLEVCRISRAAADQRAGRAGRTGPGICLRLWTEREQQGMAQFETPEVLRVDLASPVLELLQWGEADPGKFAWFEAPPDEPLDRALVLLRRLGAIDDAGLTALGRQMVRLPVHPRIARLLLAGHAAGHSQEAALAAAILAERDPFRQGERHGQPLEHWSASDVLDRMAMVEEFERGRAQSSGSGKLNRNAARFILRARDQLLRLLDREPGDNNPSNSIPVAEAVGRALFTAYPDRLARRRAPESRRAVMVGGRGVCLAPESAVVESELFVCVEIQEIGQSESLVRQASAVERDWLPAERLQVSVDLEFDPQRQRVLAVRHTRFEDLVIDEAPTGVPPGADAAEIFAREAAARLEPAHWFDAEAQSFVARVELLRRHLPEMDWPPLDVDDPNRLLPELCRGCVSFEDLRRKSILPLLQSRLDYRQLAALDREAPPRIRVPSGSQIAVDYAPGKPPSLAVRIQELYGMAETPRIAGGRARLVLHLLAPNMRPQQVTDDLASFWANTYAQVRKDLKRRYPKHSWPDDPANAQAECAPGRRR